jgi:hypothetical protein
VFGYFFFDLRTSIIFSKRKKDVRLYWAPQFNACPAIGQFFASNACPAIGQFFAANACPAIGQFFAAGVPTVQRTGGSQGEFYC